MLDLDLGVAEPSGDAVLRQLREEKPQLRCVVYTGNDKPEWHERFDQGDLYVDAWLSKGTATYKEIARQITRSCRLAQIGEVVSSDEDALRVLSGSATEGASLLGVLNEAVKLNPIEDMAGDSWVASAPGKVGDTSSADSEPGGGDGSSNSTDAFTVSEIKAEADYLRALLCAADIDGLEETARAYRRGSEEAESDLRKLARSLSSLVPSEIMAALGLSIVPKV